MNLDMKENKQGIRLKYYLECLIIAFKQTRNFRIHLFIAILVIIVSLFLQINMYEWLFVLFAISFVIITELINSVTERLIDYLKPENNINAKEIKDISAGFVLIAVVNAIFVGLIIFIPKIMRS